MSKLTNEQKYKWPEERVHAFVESKPKPSPRTIAWLARSGRRRKARFTMADKNALAELAEEIQSIVTFIYYGSGECGAVEARKIAKAQRIVAELAKFWRPCASVELLNDYVAAFDSIRAIAEEGADNGK